MVPAEVAILFVSLHREFESLCSRYTFYLCHSVLRFCPYMPELTVLDCKVECTVPGPASGPDVWHVCIGQCLYYFSEPWSSANSWHSSACSPVFVASATCIMSLTIPDAASQSGQSDQLAPSPSWPGPLASDHLRLMASATTFDMPGRCLMSVMFRQ